MRRSFHAQPPRQRGHPSLARRAGQKDGVSQENESLNASIRATDHSRESRPRLGYAAGRSAARRRYYDSLSVVASRSASGIRLTPTQAKRRTARRSIRPRLESLEDRVTPSVPTDPIPYTPGTVFKVGNYWIDVPASYDPTHKTPTELLVWSHGCGGRSEGDIYNVLPTAGGPTYIAITVDGREGACWDVNADPPVILSAIADVETHFNIDPQRVVLGGYSSGGDLSYRIAFTHSTEIAGVLAENTSPFRDTGLTQDQALAAPFHFHVVHLCHTEDEAYPIDGVRAETDAVQAAGLPGDGWATLQRIELPGTHYDPDNGNTGTVYDMKTYLLPHLADGWTSPGIAAPTVTTNPSSQTVTAGRTATFTAAASGNPASHGAMASQHRRRHDLHQHQRRHQHHADAQQCPGFPERQQVSGRLQQQRRRGHHEQCHTHS